MSHSIDLFHIQGVCEAEELFTRRKENKRNGVLAEEMACGEEEKRKRNEGRKIEEKERNNSERITSHLCMYLHFIIFLFFLFLSDLIFFFSFLRPSHEFFFECVPCISCD
jgi:hypothetical protein